MRSDTRWQRKVCVDWNGALSIPMPAGEIFNVNKVKSNIRHPPWMYVRQIKLCCSILCYWVVEVELFNRLYGKFAVYGDEEINQKINCIEKMCQNFELQEDRKVRRHATHFIVPLNIIVFLTNAYVNTWDACFDSISNAFTRSMPFIKVNMLSLF